MASECGDLSLAALRENVEKTRKSGCAEYAPEVTSAQYAKLARGLAIAPAANLYPSILFMLLLRQKGVFSLIMIAYSFFNATRLLLSTPRVFQKLECDARRGFYAHKALHALCCVGAMLGLVTVCIRNEVLRVGSVTVF